MPTQFSESIQATRAKQAADRKQQAEFQAMIIEMKRTQAASLAGSSKPSVILTDQTDLGDKVKELTTKAVAAIQGLDTTEHHKGQLLAIRQLTKDVQALQTALRDNTNAVETQTRQIVTAISNLEMSPRITVPEPRVTINEKSIDFKPLQKAIDGLKVSKSVSLSDYRAHDLDTAPDSSQYIGYIAMDGSWYIIHSDDSNNSMRYCFGKGDYTTAWGDRWSHDYTTLSEAIHALAT